MSPRAQSSSDWQAKKYKYKVKFINPKKKSDFVLLTWHQVSSRFETIAELKLKLIDDFQDFVSLTPNFQVGFIEGRSTQQWMVAREDLDTMYKSTKDDEITLWCDKKVDPSEQVSQSRKRKNTDSEDGTPASKASKADEREQELLQIVDQLTSKHSGNFSVPQLRLWAKYIQSKRHDSYDEPPNIPLITGTPDTRKFTRKESFGDALAGAATAIVRALKPQSPKRSSTPTGATSSVSPNSHANLRRKHLEDLRTLHSLLEDGVLTDEEYTEQKQSILSTLRQLNPTCTPSES